MDSQKARIIAAQLFVSKNLKKDPAKAVKFIQLNLDYFPSITEEDLENVIKENNITEEDLENVKGIRKFADINTEQKAYQKQKQKDKEIHKKRSYDYGKRDHGKGFKINPKENDYSSV